MSEASGTGSLEEMGVAELVEYVRQLRGESAQRRVALREAEDRATQLANESAARAAEVEAANAATEEVRGQLRKSIVAAVVTKYNVPESRVKFISGSTEEEIEEAAKALGEAGESNSNQGPPVEKEPEKTEQAKQFANLFPGTRGAPVGSSGESADDLLRRKLLGA